MRSTPSTTKTWPEPALLFDRALDTRDEAHVEIRLTHATANTLARQLLAHLRANSTGTARIAAYATTGVGHDLAAAFLTIALVDQAITIDGPAALDLADDLRAHAGPTTRDEAAHLLQDVI